MVGGRVGEGREKPWNMHPRTGRRYSFPRDSKRYLALVYRIIDAPHCRYGHLGCAAWEGGPCHDEHCSHLMGGE